MRTAGCGFSFPACGAPTPTVQETITLSVEAPDRQQADCMTAICRDEAWVLKSMESACERNRELQEKKQQLQERKRQMEEQLRAQHDTLEALQRSKSAGVAGTMWGCAVPGIGVAPVSQPLAPASQWLPDSKPLPVSQPLVPASQWLLDSRPLPVSQPMPVFSQPPPARRQSAPPISESVYVVAPPVPGVAKPRALSETLVVSETPPVSQLMPVASQSAPVVSQPVLAVSQSVPVVPQPVPVVAQPPPVSETLPVSESPLVSETLVVSRSLGCNGTLPACQPPGVSQSDPELSQPAPVVPQPVRAASHQTLPVSKSVLVTLDAPTSQVPVSQPSALYSILPLSKTSGGNGFEFEREVSIHTAQVHGVAMGKSSDVIATASSDRSVKIFNLSAQEVVQTFDMDASAIDAGGQGIYAVAFCKTVDELVGCTSSDQSVYLWNHQTGLLNHKFNGHAQQVNCIDFHATQAIMATGSSDCRCILWDAQEGILMRSLDGHPRDVYGCTFLGQENQFLIATGCLDQHARVFDIRKKTEVASLKEHTANVIGMDFCWQKNVMATGSDDGTICVWDTRTWTLSRRIDVGEGGSKNEVKRVAFSPNGDMIAAGSASGQVLVYGTEDGSRRAALDGHSACAFDVAWGVEQQTDAKLLVSASHDQTCRLWRVAM